MFLTLFPPTGQGNSWKAPLVRRHIRNERSSVQDRAADTQSPRGTWRLRACPHSLEPHPSPTSPFLPISPSFRGAGRGLQEHRGVPRALERVLPASVPIFPRGRARLCPVAAGARGDGDHTWRPQAVTDRVRAPGCPSAPPAPWEKCEALTQAGSRGGPALQTPDPRPPT